MVRFDDEEKKIAEDEALQSRHCITVDMILVLGL